MILSLNTQIMPQINTQVRSGNLYSPYLRNRSWCRTRIYFPNFYLNGKHSVPELNERSYSLFSTLFMRWETTQLNSRLKRRYFVFRVFKLPRKCSVASGNRFILSHFSFIALILLHFLKLRSLLWVRRDKNLAK